jgi:hypothetical protein
MILAFDLMALLKERFKLGSEIWYSENSNAFILYEKKYYL